jgi:hypothetical protein
VPVTISDLANDYEVLVHFSPTTAQRKIFAKQGVAMPGGSFFIRNASDLDNAISAVGRATPNADESETARRNAVRRHIMERARFLKLESRIPDTWNSDGTLKHSRIQGLRPNFVIYDEAHDEAVSAILDEIVTNEFLEHFGVKGMHWGVRRNRSTGTTPSHTAPRRGTFRKVGSTHPKHTVAVDAARTIQLKSQLGKHGPQSLSNQDLQHLVKRMQLENQLAQLNQKDVSTGRKITSEVAKAGGQIAKQTAKEFAGKYAAKGVEHLIKMAMKK